MTDNKPQRGKKVLDITKEVQKTKQKGYVEIEFKFKGDDTPMTLKSNTMVQAHGELSRMCKERGVNYRNAFEYHNVIQ